MKSTRDINYLAAAILFFIPVGTTDRRQEPAPFFFIREDLPVEIFRVPVDQYAAQVEYQCVNFVRVHDLYYTCKIKNLSIPAIRHYIRASLSAAFSSVSSFLAKQNRITLSSFPDW